MSAALTIPVDEAMLARIDALAEERAMSRDDILRFAVIDFLEAQTEDLGELAPWQRAEIEAGLVDLDSGALTSDAELDRIMKKYDRTG